VTVIERWILRDRIDFLAVCAESCPSGPIVDGYDSSLAHAIKRLDQAISFFWGLDTAASPR